MVVNIWSVLSVVATVLLLVHAIGLITLMYVEGVFLLLLVFGIAALATELYYIDMGWRKKK